MKGIVLAILLMQLGVVETAAQSLRVDDILTLLAQGPAKGSEGAPITIIEFSDFQCSYCRKFWQETLSRLEAEYVKPGQDPIRVSASGHPGRTIGFGRPGDRVRSGAWEILGVPRQAVCKSGPLCLYDGKSETLRKRAGSGYRCF